MTGGESREVQRQRAGRFRFRFPAAAKSFALLYNVETGSWAHSAFYSMDIEHLSPVVKRPDS